MAVDVMRAGNILVGPDRAGSAGKCGMGSSPAVAFPFSFAPPVIPLQTSWHLVQALYSSPAQDWGEN